jgi:predicted nucleic acid-binding protein
MLVIDASVAVSACAQPDGFQIVGGDRHELVGPPLMWSEARSILRLRSWTGDIAAKLAPGMLERLEEAPVNKLDPPELGRRAWKIAEEFGWGRTYDAEYVALAAILKCRLLTVDGRLRRGTDRLGFVLTPDELNAAADQPGAEAD